MRGTRIVPVRGVLSRRSKSLTSKHAKHNTFSAMAQTQRMLATGAAIGSLVLHLLLLQYEFDRYPLSIPAFILWSSFLIAFILQSSFTQFSGFSSQVIALTVVFVTANIFVYKMLFHPLQHFPGARFSKFWSLWKAV